MYLVIFVFSVAILHDCLEAIDHWRNEIKTFEGQRFIGCQSVEAADYENKIQDRKLLIRKGEKIYKSVRETIRTIEPDWTPPDPPIPSKQRIICYVFL